MRSETKLSSISTQKRPVQLYRVLIVDDHPLFRDGLRAMFQQMPEFVVVAEAESEDQAFRKFVESSADLVIVDVSLAAGNGLNLIARIKEQSDAAIVLVVSMYEDRIYAELALAAGASGYVCKHTGSDEVCRALELVTEGKVYLSSDLRGEQGPDCTFGDLDLAQNDRKLSSRELQIFTMIGDGRGTHEIADELQIAVSTVETYRERLKTKLNLKSGSALTRHAVLWVMNCSSPSHSRKLSHDPPQS